MSDGLQQMYCELFQIDALNEKMGLIQLISLEATSRNKSKNEIQNRLVVEFIQALPTAATTRTIPDEPAPHLLWLSTMLSTHPLIR